MSSHRRRLTLRIGGLASLIIASEVLAYLYSRVASAHRKERMNLIAAILLGLTVGALVELTLPGHTLSEGLLTALLGVAGSLVTRFVGQRVGWFGTDEPQCFLAEIAGSVVVLILYLISVPSHRRRRFR